MDKNILVIVIILILFFLLIGSTTANASPSKIAVYSDFKSISDNSKTIYGLSTYADALKSQGYEVKQISDPITSQKLEGFDALFITNVRDGTFSSSEMDAIEEFVEVHDKGLLLADSNSYLYYLTSRFEGGSDLWLGGYVICDPTDYEVHKRWVKIRPSIDHPLTKNVDQFIIYKGTNIPAAKSSGTIKTLASSDSDSWLEQNGNYKYDSSEPRGPHPALAYSTKDKIVIVSDSNVFDNSDGDNDDVVAFNEYDNNVLGLNIANWLTGSQTSEDEIIIQGEVTEPNGQSVGSYNYMVKIEKILQKGNANIQIGDKIIVHRIVYPGPSGSIEEKNLKVGDKVEAYGKYHYDDSTFTDHSFTWHKLDLYGSNSYYLELLDSKKPDLVIQDISWSPSNPEKDETVNFDVKIKNQGLATSGNSKIKYYINGDYIGSDSVNTISLETTTTESFSWTPNNCGNFKIKAIADVNNEVEEISEINNQKVETLDIKCPNEQEYVAFYSNSKSIYDTSKTSSGLSYFANALENKGYAVEQINTPFTESKLNSYNALIIIGTTNYLSNSDLEALDKYKNDTNRGVLYCGASGSVVCDPTDYESRKDFILVENIDHSNSVVEEITNNVNKLILYQASHFWPTYTAGRYYLASTDDDSWIDENQNFNYDSGERKGNFFVVDAFTLSEKTVRVSDKNMFDNSDWDNDGVVAFEEYDNDVLGMNIVDWLIGNQDSKDDIIIQGEVTEPENQAYDSTLDYMVKIEKIIQKGNADIQVGDEVLVRSVVFCDPLGTIEETELKIGDKVEAYGRYIYDDSTITGHSFTWHKLDLCGSNSYYLKLLEDKKPDLMVKDISWSPSDPEKGDEIKFTVDIKNQGFISSESSTVKYYINGNHVASDAVGSISSGSIFSETFQWDADICGDVNVKAVVDSENIVSESDEYNNEKSETVNITCDGSLTVTIGPTDVKSQSTWRLLTGPDTDWHSSGETVDSIPAGYYTVVFNEVDEWIRPNPIPITIDKGSNSASTKYLKNTDASIWSYETDEYEFLSVDISKNGNYIAAGDSSNVYYFSKDGNLLWDYNTNGEVYNVDISADGKYIVASCPNVFYYFSKDGTILWSYSKINEIDKAIISDDGKIIVAIVDNKLYYFSADGKIQWTFDTDKISSISTSSDGKYIAASSSNNIYYFTDKGKLLWKNDIGSYKVSVSSDGEYIAAGFTYYFSKEGDLLWENNNIRYSRFISVPSDGEDLVIGQGSDMFAGIYHFSKEGNLNWKYTPDWQVNDVSISADGKHVVGGTWDDNLYYLSKDGKLLWSYKKSEQGWIDVSTSADGQGVAAISYVPMGSDKVYYFSNQYLKDKSDLIIEDISWNPQEPSQGNEIEFTVKVKNQCSQNSESSVVDYYVDDNLIKTFTVPKLAPNSTYAETFTWTAEKHGDVQVKAIVDPDNLVSESDDSNNERARSLNIKQATGSLSVSINPSELRSKAKWKLTSGPDNNWHSSGEQINNIPIGDYEIEFKDISGWVKPDTKNMKIVAGSNSKTVTYQKEIEPKFSIKTDKSIYDIGDTCEIQIQITNNMDSQIEYLITGEIYPSANTKEIFLEKAITLSSKESKTIPYTYQISGSTGQYNAKVSVKNKNHGDEYGTNETVFYIATEKSLNIDIKSPVNGFKVNKNIPQLVRIKIVDKKGNIIPGFSVNKAEATFSNGDQNIVLYDDGKHYDYKANDGYYANIWYPESINSEKEIGVDIKIKVYAENNILKANKISGVLNPKDFILLDKVHVYENNPAKSSTIAIYYNVSKGNHEEHNLFLEMNRKNKDNLEYFDYTINSFGQLSLSIPETVDYIQGKRGIKALSWDKFKQKNKQEIDILDRTDIPLYIEHKKNYEDATVGIRKTSDIDKITSTVGSLIFGILDFIIPGSGAAQVGFFFGVGGYILDVSDNSILNDADIIIGKNSLFDEFNQHNTRDTVTQKWSDENKEYMSVVSITPFKFNEPGKKEIPVQLFADLERSEILYNKKIILNAFGVDEEPVKPVEPTWDWSNTDLEEGFELLDNEIIYSNTRGYDPKRTTAVSVSRKVDKNNERKQILFFEISRKTNPEKDYKNAGTDGLNPNSKQGNQYRNYINGYYNNLRDITFQISFDEDTYIIYDQIKEYEIGDRTTSVKGWETSYKYLADGDQLTDSKESFIPQFFEYTHAIDYHWADGTPVYTNFYERYPSIDKYEDEMAKKKLILSCFPYVGILGPIDSALGHVVDYLNKDKDIIGESEIYKELFDINEKDLVIKNFLRERRGDYFESIVVTVPVILDENRQNTDIHIRIPFTVSDKEAVYNKKITLDKNYVKTQDDPDFKKEFILKCPANLHVYDKYGNHVGLNPDGTIDREIPNIYYKGANSGRESVTVFDNLELDIEIEGYGNGKFNLTMMTQSTGNITNTEYTNVPLSENTIATLTVDKIIDSIPSIDVDNDGDGTVDYAQKANSTEKISIPSTIYVPLDYPNINEAISHSQDNDTIYVLSGLYNETVFVNKTLNIIGEDMNSTILQCDEIGIYNNKDDVTISGFTIRNCSEGIHLEFADRCYISGNVIKDNKYGINLHNSNNNSIVHNNFLDNEKQIIGSGANLLNHEYPFGGNYWDNYNGIDEHKGSNQSEIGEDGIGDTAYNITGVSDLIDKYPFINENGWLYQEFESQQNEKDDKQTPSSSGSSGGSSGGGGGGGTTGEEFENIVFKDVKSEYVMKGDSVSYDFDDTENVIEYVRFDALRTRGDVSTTIEVLDDTSALVENKAPGNIYCNVNVWVGKAGFAIPENIENPVIGFRVEKSWIENNNIDESTIRLCRCNDGTWDPLTTRKLSEDEEYMYFESDTPSFSPFAITAMGIEEESKATTGSNESMYSPETKPPMETNESSPTGDTENSSSTPGFSALIAIGIILAVYCIKKKKN